MDLILFILTICLIDLLATPICAGLYHWIWWLGRAQGYSNEGSSMPQLSLRKKS